MAQHVATRDLHRVVGVCFVYRRRDDGEYEYLILKRLPTLKVYPNLWTIPGGGMERSDYERIEKTSPDGWEKPLETVVRREVRDESNVEVGTLTYINDFTFVRPDDIPVLGIRFAAPYVSGEPRVDPDDASELKWITVREVSNYEFLGNIVAEIQALDARLQMMAEPR